MNGTETQAGTGLLGTVKEHVPVDTIVGKFQESRGTLLDIGLYGGIGLLVGFFMKKYSTLVVFIVLMALSLYVFQHFNFITINWSVVYTTLGIQSAALLTTESLFYLATEWAKSNIVATASIIVGFLLGLKIG